MLRRVLLVVLVLAGCDLLEPSSEDSPVPATKLPVEPAEADEAAPCPKGSLREGPVSFSFAVYGLPEGNDVETKARAVLKTHASSLPEFKPEDLEVGVHGVALDLPSIATFAPPDPEALGFMGEGLSDAEVAAVQSSKTVAVLRFSTGDASKAEALVDEAQAIVAEIAQQAGGLPWDERTRQLFSRTAWAERTKLGPATKGELWRHFTVHSYRDGELIRMVSLGLGKFGLPEIAVDQVAAGDSPAIGELINATAEAMLRGAEVGADGSLQIEVGTASEPHVVHLGVGTRDEGDAPGRLVVFRFPGTGGVQERHAALLTRIFGDSDSQIIDAAADDQELLAASANAKKDLAKLQSHFADGIPDLEMLIVKAPFDTDDGGVEWMWVEVTSWDGETMKGVLQNSPRAVAGLREGAKVEVKVASVFDYIHEQADGTRVGGKTSEILERRAGG